MVRKITKYNEREIIFTHIFDFLIRVIPLNNVKKAFGNLFYEKTDTVGKYDFEKSMEETEKEKKE